MKRCAWVNLKNELYCSYHDNEWGIPVHNDQKLFEMLTLEGAQAGLSWEIILKKRENYRLAFDDFNPRKISKYNKDKERKLLNNSGIIRNKLKIKSVIQNSKVFLNIQKEFGSFDKYIWSFVNNKPIQSSFKKNSNIPTKTKLSDKISRDLKKRGMSFVGSTIIYAFMQSIGIVNDHEISCFKHKL